MKYIFVGWCICIMSILYLGCTAETKVPEAKNEKANSFTTTLTIADPTIFYHEGTYYLYGTSAAGKGFLVYTSKDLKKWHGPKGVQNGFALMEGNTYGTGGFWAPQVFYYQGMFYMAYTANEHIAIAKSKSPLGPFIQEKKIHPIGAPVKQIDPYVYIDDDGTKYLYHVRLTNGNKIFVAKLTDDFSSIKPETLQLCIKATEPWENTTQASWPVTEGPSILKHDGLYYLIYSANDYRNPDYAVGYATSKTPYGPWKKYEGNPVISKEIVGKNGTGHGDYFRDEQGNLHYIFHTHNSYKQVHPRKTAMVKIQFKNTQSGIDKLIIVEESFHYLQEVNKVDS